MDHVLLGIWVLTVAFFRVLPSGVPLAWPAW